MGVSMKKIFFVLALVFCVTFLFADDIVFESGNIKIISHEYSGSVSLYAKSKKSGKYVSLIDNSNYSVSSGFYLQIDEVSRKLERTYDIDVATEIVEDGVLISYQVKNKALVDVLFTPFASTNSKQNDCIKVEISVTNLSDYDEDFALKAVFDTLLGEASKKHFYTATQNPITSEQFIESIKKQKYVASSNGYNSVGFLFSGANISEPESVILGNRDVLLQKAWNPQIVSGRSFDSISSMNNSALAVLWRSFELSSLNKSSIVFYISTSTDKKAFPLEKSFPNDVLAFDVVQEEDSVTYTDSYGMNYTVGVHKSEQLDPEYIADLLNRIHNLEINADGSNRDEIKKLNAELDAIMQKIQRLKTETDANN